MLGLLYRTVGALVAVLYGLALFPAGAGDPERRRRLREKLGLWDGQPSGSWIWIHGASVGETAMAVALAEALAARVPGTRLVVSSTTATGRAVSATKHSAESRYFPIDFAPLVTRLIRSNPPRLFVAVETEIWPATLAVLGAAGVPIAFVNARLSDRSFARYRRLRHWLVPLLGKTAGVFARDEESARRWLELGARKEAVVVLGDLKFDLASSGGEGSDRLGLAAQVGREMVVAASTHSGEEEVVLEAFAAVLASKPGLRLLLAPRHPERASAVLGLARRAGRRAATWSEGWGDDVEVVVLDRMGLLGEAYAVSAAAFVGGSLVDGPGGHNLLEPVMAGCPVSAGPRLGNVPEQADVLRSCAALRVVSDAGELSRFWMEVLDHPAEFVKASAVARDAVEARRGALGRTVEALLPLLRGGEAA